MQYLVTITEVLQAAGTILCRRSPKGYAEYDEGDNRHGNDTNASED